VTRFRWWAISVFALGMAFAEAATVVFLKRLYFPDGWAAPFHPIPPDALRLEQGRELATLAAIAAVAFAGRPGAREGIARALWIGGLWDLAYYGCLRAITPFPATLADLDVVFLVPSAWILPVWVPVAASLVAMAAAFALGRPAKTRRVLG
jgi:hypothetical protein